MRVHTQRLPRNRHNLLQVLQSAANKALTDPAWPSAILDPVEIVAMVSAFQSQLASLQALEMQTRNARGQVGLTQVRVIDMLKRIDGITTMVFGESGAGKIGYGLRPIDRTRNRPPAPTKVVRLNLGDGKKPGTLTASWKRQVRASYRVEWALNPEFTLGLQTELSTRARIEIAGPIGTRVFVRVRAFRGGVWSATSASASRIVN